MNFWSIMKPLWTWITHPRYKHHSLFSTVTLKMDKPWEERRSVKAITLWKDTIPHPRYEDVDVIRRSGSEFVHFLLLTCYRFAWAANILPVGKSKKKGANGRYSRDNRGPRLLYVIKPCSTYSKTSATCLTAQRWHTSERYESWAMWSSLLQGKEWESPPGLYNVTNKAAGEEEETTRG